MVDVAGLVITHEAGYREIDLTVSRLSPSDLGNGHMGPDLATFNDSVSMNVILNPWARVEGSLFSGQQPLEGQSIKLWRIDFESALVSMGTKTGAGGRFAFEGISAGEYRLEMGSGTNLGWVAVKAGETANLVVRP